MRQNSLDSDCQDLMFSRQQTKRCHSDATVVPVVIKLISLDAKYFSFS